MATRRIPLSVLDLVPIAQGSSAGQALRHTIELARDAEALGYHRYWIAEHHLNPGVVSSAPEIVITMVAGATSRIRVGSGAVLMGHHTPLAVVEQFGLIDALHPGRIDLGLGRSGGRRPPGAPPADRSAPRPPSTRLMDHRLVVPPKFVNKAMLSAPRFKVMARLLQQPGACTPEYRDQLAEVLSLLDGPYRADDGTEVEATPRPAEGMEVWVLGSGGGDSAAVAGELGLPFAAAYHFHPGSVFEAVDAYRHAFRASRHLTAPRLMVSADVVVAPTDAEARHAAQGYGQWVASIRSGRGAIPFPTPEEAARHVWSDDERALVADRVATQFAGAPGTVADQLEVLADETGADELIVTTIVHDHNQRRRSQELLAAEWSARDH